MNTSTLLQSLLTLHLLGLITMAGTTLIDYSTFKTFWKQFDKDQSLSPGLLEARSKFSRIAGIGAAVLILTGFGMMAVTHGVFGEQLWFRIKFALVILLISNSLIVGRRQGIKLNKLSTGTGDLAQISLARTYLNRFYLTQLTIFLVIVFLSVFKFS